MSYIDQLAQLEVGQSIPRWKLSDYKDFDSYCNEYYGANQDRTRAVCQYARNKFPERNYILTLDFITRESDKIANVIEDPIHEYCEHLHKSYDKVIEDTSIKGSFDFKFANEKLGNEVIKLNKTITEYWEEIGILKSQKYFLETELSATIKNIKDLDRDNIKLRTENGRLSDDLHSEWVTNVLFKSTWLGKLYSFIYER